VLLNEVMDALTTAVMEHGGTLIDYYGDGLAAMWNAPVDQPTHPVRACQAAMQMLAALPDVSSKWQQVLDAPLRLGIGVHTGPAQVGNIGSSQRLKYGPRGPTVNLASRLEQATKLLGTPLVVTREVVERLDRAFIDLRVCQAELPGIEEAVDIYTLHRRSGCANVLAAITRYEDALTHYEAGDLEMAKEQLHELDQSYGLPVEFLIGQIDREHHRRLGRRAGDEQPHNGTTAIQLSVK
jgi:adenylate cyclase